MSGREQDSRAGVMMIAGDKGMPCRSLTAFVRYSVFIAGVCFRAVFVSSFWRSVAAYIHERGLPEGLGLLHREII